MVVKKVVRVYGSGRVSKPVVIRLKKKDGSFVELKGVRIVKKPQKVVFRKIKRKYLRPEVEGDKDE